jgi:hypothetical protein
MKKRAGDKFKGIAPVESAARTPTQRRNKDAATLARRVGRPSGAAGGKRSDPDYIQTSIYLRREVHEQLRDALHDVNKGKRQQDRRDLGDLLEEWAEKWLKAQK